MKPVIVAAFALVASAADAQHGGKVLSSAEVAQYRAGAGMGYAKAAELNHFPGPMHVLELADRLGLSDAQREATRRLMDAHKAEARGLGAKLVEAELAVDQLFATGSVDPAALAERVRQASVLQGAYRLSHLETHRRMRSLLSADQVRRYDELRGYAAGAPAHEHRH